MVLGRGAQRTICSTDNWFYNTRMCGRFTLRTPTPVLIKQFGIEIHMDLIPRFNIAPTQDVAVVRLDPASEQRELAMLHWGLIPSWAKDPAIGNRMINARGETVTEKPSFRTAFRRRRCLVLADGYYEWKKTGSKKQPYYIRMTDEGAFGLAGLWERWKVGEGDDPQTVESCTVITTEANSFTSDIHDRMPVILEPNDWTTWLDISLEDREELEPLLRPYFSEEMRMDPVSTLVNNPRNEDPKCVEIQGELF